jgi:hypothetical protein
MPSREQQERRMKGGGLNGPSKRHCARPGRHHRLRTSTGCFGTISQRWFSGVVSRAAKQAAESKRGQQSQPTIEPSTNQSGCLASADQRAVFDWTAPLHVARIIGPKILVAFAWLDTNVACSPKKWCFRILRRSVLLRIGIFQSATGGLRARSSRWPVALTVW